MKEAGFIATISLIRWQLGLSGSNLEHREVEITRPRRICWLSIRRVPLHLWNEVNFHKIGSV